MKILFVTQSIGKGGAERLVLDMAQSFMKDYEDVTIKIVSLSPVNDFKELSKGLDIEVCNSRIELSLSGKSKIEISDFERIVDEFEPNVIHSHTYIAELVSRENARPNIAYFTHVHSDFPEFNPFSISSIFNKTKLTRLFERNRIFKRYRKINNHFISISTTIDNYLRTQLSRDWSKKIHLIPNGINFSKFDRSPRKINSANDIELVTIGRLFPVKNQHFLLDVLNELNNGQARLKFKLHIIGEGPERECLKKKIIELHLENQVSMHGLVDQVENILGSSHIYVHSATSEPFGLVIAEAMASSLPVITLTTSGPADIIENEISGVLLPQSSTPKEFAKKILELVENPLLYQNIAIYANKKAAQFDISICVNRHYKLYNSLIKSVNTR